MKNVHVSGKDYEVPRWVALESQESLLLLEDVPFWAFRAAYGMSYGDYQETRSRSAAPNLLVV